MAQVKVRFAPSPTGFMHIGNSRIAIINYLFCRKNNGHFLFRIDDTDVERSKKEYEDVIRKDLDWLGIKFDSFFRQSERVNRYQEVQQKLIDQGLLYKCYETPEELEYKRKLAIGKGKPPVYDRASLNLSLEAQKELEQQGIKPYWRFKLPEQIVSWNDLIMGPISYDLKSLSDPVIAKSDGTYLYSFSSVIDDFDSGITHIIRGQDHTTNTAIQIALFNAIAGQPHKINFAHLSLLVNKDGSEFSKRLGSLNLGNLRDQGIEPMTICDLMATFGSSLDVRPFSSMSDLIAYFDLSKFSTNSPKFNIEEVFALNKKVLHKYSFEQVCRKGIQIEEEAFNIVHENIEKLSDFKHWQDIFSSHFKNQTELTQSEKRTAEICLKIVTEKGTDDLMNNLKAETGLKGVDLFMPIRKALTGLDHGPNINEIINKLGTEEITRRLGQVAN